MSESNIVFLIINIGILLINVIGYVGLRKYERKLNKLLNETKALLDRARDIRLDSKRLTQMAKDIVGDND